MHPEFVFQGRTFLYYDILNYVAMAAVALYLFCVLPSIQIKRSQILLFLVLGYPVQLFGGKILPSVYYYMTHRTGTPVSLKMYFMQWAGRFFHSVFLSSLAYTLVICKVFRWPTKKVLDLWVVGVLMVSAIGRVGCVLQGCCQGKACDLPWAVHLPPNLTVARHPTQIYMLIVETVLTIFLWFFNKKKRYDGQVFWMAIFLYSIYRILIETIRVNPTYYGLTPAQIFSIFSLGLSGWVLYKQKHAQ